MLTSLSFDFLVEHYFTILQISLLFSEIIQTILLALRSISAILDIDEDFDARMGASSEQQWRFRRGLFTPFEVFGQTWRRH